MWKRPNTRAHAPNISRAISRGAVYVDWTSDIIDPDDPVPVQIAPPERFAEAMAVRGIGDDSLVVAVDHTGGQFATRLWWALSYYGHDDVRVLDGGWNAWVKDGRAVETGEVEVERADFTAEPQVSLRATARQLAGLLHHPDLEWQLVDAPRRGSISGRAAPRCAGGAISRVRSTCRGNDSSARKEGFLPIEEIRARVDEFGLRSDRPTVAYCNGGGRGHGRSL